MVESVRHQSEKHTFCVSVSYDLCSDFFHRLYFVTSGKSLKLSLNLLFFPPAKQKENILLKILNHRIMKWPRVKGVLKI